MFSREDVVKLLLSKKGVDVYAPGGVSFHSTLSQFYCKTNKDFLVSNTYALIYTGNNVQ